MKSVIAALREVFSVPLYWGIAVTSFAVFLLLYLVTLPATFTGGRIGLAAFAFLTPELALWSALMSVLIAALLPMTVYLLKRGYKAHPGAAAGGLIVSILTPLLCCSPVLPIAFGFLAGLIPALAGGVGGAVQGFLATHEAWFFGIATAILALALYQNAREVVKGACCKI